jgi:cyclase
VLAKRIIPTMLVRGRTLVKGERFNSWRSIGHAAQAARVHAMRGVDELLILDIAATAESRGPDLDMVSELADGCHIPITVGGGVRRIEDIRNLLLAGADKVCIGTAFFEKPNLVKEAASKFGSQAIVVSVDSDAGSVTVRCGSKDWGYLHGPTWTEPKAVATLAQTDGAGEILLQSVNRDGTMEGYDIDLIREVASALTVPLIVSGGCSGFGDMARAFAAGADACAVGALFAFSDATPRGAALYLKDQGLEVRL